MSSAKRRPKGDGTFWERADGTWAYQENLGTGLDGKRIRRTIYAKTRTELKRKVQDLRAKSGGSLKPRARGTVAEWVEQWLEQDVKPNLSRNTYALYETMWRLHAQPSIGPLKLEKLEPAHVANLYARLRANGASATIIQKTGAVMQRAIAVATRRGVFHRANPFELVDRPTPQPKTGHELTIEEARRFLAVLRDSKLWFEKIEKRFEARDASANPVAVELEALFVLLVTAGLRLGEALALEWSDIDFERGRLSIRHAATEVGGVVEICEPKTKGSRRAVELGALAIAAFRRRREAAEEEHQRPKLIFSTTSGTPLHRSNVRGRHFEPILKRAGIPHVTIHGLRHAMTSFGIGSGISAKVLAERLGHSTTRLTQDRYAHVLPGMQREAAEAIDELLR